ncbi:hypothetical protein [Flavobacterium sp.]|uniref:hypothetical protein n=1 Tax=Flavobacterium sp. TaxID=239 RepID=UPI0038D19B07
MVQKINSIPIAMQAANIKSLFPDTKVYTFLGQELSWTHTVKPSPLGGEYVIKLVYKINGARTKYGVQKTTSAPKIYVLSPKLELAVGKTRLPHCYDQKTQHLCLYYPDGKEWNKSMLLTATVIPWAYEWLYHYELWLGTGEWTGGGVHPQNSQSKI